MGAFAASAATLSEDDLAFFESEVRPLLVDNCYKCHSADSEKIRGNFLIDSQPGMLRGGESGPSIVPGSSAESRLIQMVERHPDFEAMPPKSKLSRAEIDTLAQWIDRGAPDPRIEESIDQESLSDFNLEERKDWWSLQPITTPNVPEVHNTAWPANEYDQFLLQKLEAKNWQPAPPADPATLLRRLSFDLTGLAPTPRELEAFLADPSPEAYAAQVDRLLASPRFGEKWARHWMDLVRYAETKAFEADYTMPYAYRYRDYLIHSLNEDVPYDQFVRESLAGDLLPEPRVDPETGRNQSAMGPGYIYLTDGQHGPPDIHEDEARVFKGMIDVTSKAFLASTLACARCHDHKFDAITTADYYSFYGMLRSSRLNYANTVPADTQTAPINAIEAKKKRIRKLAFDASQPDAKNAGRYYEVSRALSQTPSVIDILNTLDREAKKDKSLRESYLDNLQSRIAPVANAHDDESLDPETLANWLILQLSPQARAQWPELSPLFGPTESPDADEEPASQTFATLAASFDQWKIQDPGFVRQPQQPGELIIDLEGPNAIRALVGDAPVAGHHSPRISGSLRSPDFIIDGKPIEFQAKGRAASVRLVVRNYELTGRGPTTAKLYQAINSDHWQTIRMETYLWEGETAYLEILQHGENLHSLHPVRDSLQLPSDEAYVAFRPADPNDWSAYWNESNEQPEKIGETIALLLKRGKNRQANAQESELLSALFASGLLRADTNRSDALRKEVDSLKTIALQIPRPHYVRSLVDGDPYDEPVYVRGSHKNLSDESNPRRFLDALGGAKLKSPGSGRLEWIEHVANPENPLTARVQVNRLWQRIFGAGLVETANDFGRMGSAPSHPELLDYLARDFTSNGWSLKYMIRKMVLTQAYRMSSAPSSEALAEDPKNRLLQHMPVRRLEADSIRDHILFCSEELDTTMYGPSIRAYVEDLPKSRARPHTGPLDGDGRRSIYLEMRRNFLPTFLRAFDMPNATEPIGKRQTTNVPAQSLALLNDPFIHQQSTAWARTILDSEDSFEDRIQRMHQMAFSRSARPEEIEWARRTLKSLSSEYNFSPDDLAVWTDLCHIFYNRKEFIYVF